MAPHGWKNTNSLEAVHDLAKCDSGARSCFDKLSTNGVLSLGVSHKPFALSLSKGE